MPEETQYTLTELTKIARELANQLLYHTENRNYLFRVANGEETAPIIRLQTTTCSNDSPTISEDVVVNGFALPNDSLEVMLLTLIEHEEKSAISCWESLTKLVTNANELLSKMQTERAKNSVDLEEENHLLTFGESQPDDS